VIGFGQMNSYFDSNGNSYTQSQIDRKIREAGLYIIDQQFLEHGYNFCTCCKRNDDKPIDVSHIISRKEAKELRQVELSWSLDNLQVLGRKCHKKLDKLNIQH
jgi:5-methylcytosine-specific restriction endonuclease McrA